MKYKMAVLIVLYNSSIQDSETIKSLKVFIDDEKIDITIWNNGPIEIDEEYGLTVINTLENRSLAKIYNSFLSMVKADNYLFLDHDTSLPNNYITNILNNCNKGITIPRVYDNDVIHYPFYENGIYPLTKKMLPCCDTTLDKYSLIMSITSGLNISDDVVSLMKDKYTDVFDERYKLYGIDTTFFLRVSKLKIPCVINNRIEHSLSRLHSKQDASYLFREKERAIENILTMINYCSLRTIVRAFKFFMLEKRIVRYHSYILCCLKFKTHPDNKL